MVFGRFDPYGWITYPPEFLNNGVNLVRRYFVDGDTISPCIVGEPLAAPAEPKREIIAKVKATGTDT